MILLGFAVIFSSLIQDKPLKVVCLGDRPSLRFEAGLEQNLGSKFTVESISNRAALLSEKDVASAIAASPNLVLVSIGTEAALDPSWPTFRDKFVPYVEAVIARLRSASSHPKVFLCIPAPFNLADSDLRGGYLANETVPLLKQASRECECPTIDFDAALRDRADLISGTTISDLGAEILADTVTEAIFSGRKADWKILYTDSEEADEGPAKNAIDGDADTYWHTNYSTTQEKYPHEIQVDTGRTRTIGGFSYLPRQDGVNGRVAKYEFYTSMDGKSWGDPIAKGQFKRTSELTKVYFDKPVECRYIRFRALSEQQGQMWASVAELDVLKFYPKRP